MRWSFNKVRFLLDNIEECRSYYMGGSLCIDCMPHHPNIVINRNGRGFFYGGSLKGSIKFVVSNDIKEKVNEIYRRFKGVEQTLTISPESIQG